jgi:hypothetical protein
MKLSKLIVTFHMIDDGILSFFSTKMKQKEINLII